jgi:hypothetical protein
MSTSQKDIVLEQRADIKAIFAVPVIREMMRGGDGGGVHVNMIGPIYVNQVDGSKENQGMTQLNGNEEVREGPLLLRGISTEQEPIDEKTLTKFEPIYEKLPENKLDSTVRMVVEIAHRKDSSPKNVAKALNCSLYKAKSIMGKFGLSS